MISRSDIALGKPLGRWFPRRNGNASLVRLTREEKTVTVDSDEPSDDDTPGGDDDYAAERASFLDP